MKKKKLVFIVTYKSSEKIYNIINKIKKIREFKKYDIYISDDNSPDNTIYYLKRIKNHFIYIKFNKMSIFNWA